MEITYITNQRIRSMRDTKHLQKSVDNDRNITLLMFSRLVQQRKLQCLPHRQRRKVLIILLIVIDLTTILLDLLLGWDSTIRDLSSDRGKATPFVADSFEECRAAASRSAQHEQHLSISDDARKVVDESSFLTG